MHFLTSLTAALALSASPAPSFAALGRPIHPQCVTGLTVGEAPAGPIQLSACSKAKEPVEHRDDVFTWTARGEPGLRKEFSAYNVLGQQGGEWVVSWEWSGGGTGVFSGVSLLHLERGALRLVRTVAAGDRCNGGVRDPRLEKGALRYTRAATPIDVLQSVPEGRALAQGGGENFESSALSCVATIAYVGADLTSIELEDPGEDRPGWTDRFRHQGCYNAVQRAFVASGRAHLDPSGVADFARAFAQRCLSHPDAN
jgi:hypothetical protein